VNNKLKLVMDRQLIYKRFFFLLQVGGFSKKIFSCKYKRFVFVIENIYALRSYETNTYAKYVQEKKKKKKSYANLNPKPPQ
jgi:hypothetical protein